MKITINLTKKEIEHLKHCSSESDACGYVEEVIRKVKSRLPKEKK